MRTKLVVVLLILLATGIILRCETPESASPANSSNVLRLPRLELGMQTAQIRTNCVGSPGQCPIPSFALGPSATWNFKRFLAFDGSYLVTPSSGSQETDQYGGRITELLAGARLEARSKRYGFFILGEPGFLRWSDVIKKATFPTPTTIAFEFGSATHFVADTGVGAEFSPSSRIHIRGELTDLFYYNSQGSWSRYFQPMASVSYGIGPPLSWSPQPYDGRKDRFFSPVNDVLLLGNALAIAADAITTQRFIAHGYREGDPFARPFVENGWSGQIAASSLEFGAEMIVMYGLHRMHHHWIERALPVSTATVHAVFAYQNDTLSMRVR